MSTEIAMHITEVIKLLPEYDPYANCEGYYFDEKRALMAIGWIQKFCTFTKGKRFARKKLKLELWQRAIVANVFGWYSVETGLRRYREVLIYVPRKNGKTELQAAISLYLLLCDGEPGAEMYCLASNEKQAKILFEASKIMVKQNRTLDKKIDTLTNSLINPTTNSYYQPLPSEADGHHGKNVHVGIIDELHVCDQDLVDVIITGTGSRDEPIIFYTTTAAHDDDNHVCNKTRLRGKGVCDGSNPDQRFLPAIYELGKDDDWRDPENWKKANPNYGVSKQPDYMAAMCAKAEYEPSFLNKFKRLDLNIITSQSDRWLDMDKWDKCGNDDKLGEHRFRGHPDDLESMRGQECYAGLDLSDTIDTSSLALYFPKSRKVIMFFWIPEESAKEKEMADKVPYKQWAADGWLKMTPGSRIDYNYIEKKIIEVCDIVDMKQIGFDKYNATQLSMYLVEQEGLPMVIVRQGFVTMNEPCKKLEADVTKGNLNHGANPVLRSHAGHVFVKHDEANCIKPDKKKSTNKIDGIAALVDAYAVWIVKDEDESVYNTHGIRSLGGDESHTDLDDDGENDINVRSL